MPQLWGARPGRFCPSSGELGSDDEDDDDDEDKDDGKEDEGDDDVYIVLWWTVSLTLTAGIRCELARVSCNGLAAHCGWTRRDSERLGETRRDSERLGESV